MIYLDAYKKIVRWNRSFGLTLLSDRFQADVFRILRVLSYIERHLFRNGHLSFLSIIETQSVFRNRNTALLVFACFQEDPFEFFQKLVRFSFDAFLCSNDQSAENSKLTNASSGK